MTTVDGLVIRVGADLSDARQAFRNVGKAVAPMASKLRAVGSTLSVAVTAPLALAGGAAIKMGADFEVTMRRVAAASRAPRSEMEALTRTAIEMGAETRYSAQDAGDAMLELAKGGMRPAMIQGGALAATLDLAATEGLAMGEAATYVTNAIKMFGLEAGSADTVTTAFAGGATASTASVRSLGQALSQVGPGARMMGLSLQETVGILSAFDSAGIKGSDAGTSFKTMLQRLVPQTDKAREVMRALDLRFTDSSGSFLAISDIAGLLQDRFAGLSEAQRAAAMQTLFGSDATRAAAVLMRLGAAGVKEYTAAARDQAAVQQLVNAYTGSSAGAMERARGSIETAAISLRNVLLPVAVKVAGVVEALANAFTRLDPRAKTAIVALAGVAAVVGPLLVTVGAIGAALPAVAAGFALLTGPIGLTVAAITAVGGALAYIVTQWGDIGRALRLLWGHIKRFILRGISLVVETLAALLGDVPFLGTAFQGAAALARSALQGVQGEIRGVQEEILFAKAAAAGAFDDLGPGLMKMMKGDFSEAGDAIDELGQRFSTFRERLRGVAGSAAGQPQPPLAPVVPTVPPTVAGAPKVPAAPDYTQRAGVLGAGLAVGGTPTTVLDRMGFGGVGRQIGQYVHRITGQLTKAREAWGPLLADIGATLREGLNQSVGALAEGLGQMLTGAATMGDLGTRLFSLFGGVMQKLGGLLITFGTAGLKFQAAGGFLSFLTNPVAAIAAGGLLVAAGAAIKSTLGSANRSGGGGGAARSGPVNYRVNANEVGGRYANAPTAGAADLRGGAYGNGAYGGAYGNASGRGALAGGAQEMTHRVEVVATALPSGDLVFSGAEGRRRLDRYGTEMS